MEQARIHREEQALYREQQLMNEREALERRKEAFEEEKKRRLDHKVTGVTYQTVGENLVSEKSEIPREIIEAQPIIEEEPGRREEIYEEEPEESFDFLNMLSIEGLDEEDHSDTEPSPHPVPDHAEESGGSTETEKRKTGKIQDLPQKSRKSSWKVSARRLKRQKRCRNHSMPSRRWRSSVFQDAEKRKQQ